MTDAEQEELAEGLEFVKTTLSPDEATNILAFLSRVDLKGAEAPLLTQLCAKLRTIVETARAVWG